jgi:hypothetical protein
MLQMESDFGQAYILDFGYWKKHGIVAFRILLVDTEKGHRSRDYQVFLRPDSMQYTVSFPAMGGAAFTSPPGPCRDTLFFGTREGMAARGDIFRAMDRISMLLRQDCDVKAFMHHVLDDTSVHQFSHDSYWRFCPAGASSCDDGGPMMAVDDSWDNVPMPL